MAFDVLDEWLRADGYEGCLFINSLLETHRRSEVIRVGSVAALENVHALMTRFAKDAGSAIPWASRTRSTLCCEGRSSQPSRVNSKLWAKHACWRAGSGSKRAPRHKGEILDRVRGWRPQRRAPMFSSERSDL